MLLKGTELFRNGTEDSCEEALNTCSMMCGGKLLEALLWPVILLGPLVKDEVGKVLHDGEVKA